MKCTLKKAFRIVHKLVAMTLRLFRALEITLSGNGTEIIQSFGDGKERMRVVMALRHRMGFE